MEHEQPQVTPAEIPPSQEPVKLPPIRMAVACLLLGVVSILTSIYLLGALFGVLGVLAGIRHNRRHPYLRGMTTTGILLSTIGLALTVPIASWYYQAYLQFQDMMAEMETPDFSQWEGVVAPELTVTSLSGEIVSLKDLRGKRVVVDIWATWCPPCRDEIPHFERLAKEHPEELVIIGVSDEEAGILQAFVNKENVTYPIASAEDLPSPFGDVAALPTTFFIDRNGVIQTVLEGYHDFDSLREHALAEDFAGEPRNAPSSAVVDLPRADSDLPHSLIWEKKADIAAMTKGDWDGDGNEEALVLTGDGLLVLRADGSEIERLALEHASSIEMGRGPDGPRLLLHDAWGDKVKVYDSAGNSLWKYDASQGVNGAHWADINGDGIDELTVGMNGFGGLHAVSPEGKRLWRYKQIGNVWTHAAIELGDGKARIYATEASGSIYVFDESGEKIKTFRPAGGYFANVYAGFADAQGSVQVLAIASEEQIAVVCDAEGIILWQAAVAKKMKFPDAGVFHGDLDGDQRREWSFVNDKGTLQIVSSEGVVQFELENHGDIEFGAILEKTGAPGILLLYQGGVLRAHAHGEVKVIHEQAA